MGSSIHAPYQLTLLALRHANTSISNFKFEENDKISFRSNTSELKMIWNQLQAKFEKHQYHCFVDNNIKLWM